MLLKIYLHETDYARELKYIHVYIYARDGMHDDL